MPPYLIYSCVDEERRHVEIYFCFPFDFAYQILVSPISHRFTTSISCLYVFERSNDLCFKLKHFKNRSDLLLALCVNNSTPKSLSRRS